MRIVSLAVYSNLIQPLIALTKKVCLKIYSPSYHSSFRVLSREMLDYSYPTVATEKMPFTNTTPTGLSILKSYPITLALLLIVIRVEVEPMWMFIYGDYHCGLVTKEL